MKKPSFLPVESLLAQLTLPQKIAQLFLYNFVGKYELPPAIRELNRKGLLGGIIFFSGSNVEDIDQLRALTSAIQGLSAESPHGLPYFITLDQEGGQLSALHQGCTVFPGNMALGQADDPALTRACARQMGQELAWAGININFAPVLDCAIEHDKHGVPIVDNRMLGSDPALVARHGVELVAGLQESGIMACAKHFPGMRLAEVDTHHATDLIDYPLEQLEAEYFPAFRAAVKAGVKAVMTHHGVYPAFDQLPATLSKPTLDFLRKEMGFTGLIISDDLIMRAIQDQYPGAEACIMAINAGIDQIIYTGVNEELIMALARAVESGRIDAAALDQALRRVFAAKAGLAPAADQRPQQKRGLRLAREIARKALIVHQDRLPDGRPLLPLDQKSLREAVAHSRHTAFGKPAKIAVIQANPARLVMSCTVNFYDISLKGVVEKAGWHPYVKESVMPWTPTPEEQLSLFDIGFISDVVIFLTVNAYRYQGQLEILKQIHALRGESAMPRIISVATRSPDDVQLLKPLSDTVLSTGGLSEVQIEALAEALFGRSLD